MKFIISLIIFIFSFTCVSAQEIMMLKTSGKVVIGDTTQISTPGNYNLYVQNGILTERVKVSLKTTAEWSDEAFCKTPTIEEVDTHIQTKNHLIDMPSAATLVEEGYELKSMDAKLLQQIEWLWQHTIELKKENELLRLQLEQITLKK